MNEQKPIDMVLHCPKCGLQHIDASNEEEIRIKAAELGIDREGDRAYCDWLDENEWTNPPHKSHLCHGCGHIWRPADVPTNGVAFVQPGRNDSPIANGARGPSMTDHEAQRPAFEDAIWNYYQTLKANGWSNPEEGDTSSREALFWRTPAGKYGVQQIEAAWWGWKLRGSGQGGDAFERWYAQYHEDACVMYGGLSGDPKDVARDAWDSALAAPASQAASANTAPIYYMRDNHSFLRLQGTPEEMVEQIRLEFDAGYTHGMLCSKMRGFVEVHGRGDWAAFREAALDSLRAAFSSSAAAPRP